ncbi:small G protein, GTPase SAR1 [Candidatus Nitrososphaera evergladensis SR1]|jgi:GTPase SAR1 family protein|uniref:Small G protein, GTPase SAR1 n=1 Tax=Candidatus Nitrososphaera evergladensis SR1 TaxID=1459636 RepID=A0A075MU73_9ARCH|nr:ATP/GTP-binding protein [Candidatus Nitrososphaera evergladensis]AIF84267.1 small G protein, GTPase SAR1 [Candidatus Nitrososphaera evergladensis SR1]
MVNAIFVTGTAGSGKSLLTSRLLQWYRDTGAYPTTLNLDPGAVTLPYEPDIDIRNYIDIGTLMESYGLGPNGALIMASDLMATRLDEIQQEVDEANPDYLIVDTPGQIELFAFRASGPYFISNLQADNKATVFAFDGTLVSSPINFVSISLLASAVKLRLKTAQINVLTKRDLVIERLKDILDWAASTQALESALSGEKDAEYSLLSKDLSRSMTRAGFAPGLVAVSSTTMNGLVNVAAALARTLNQGEDG